MIDVSKPEFDPVRNWIKLSRNKGVEWEAIKLGRQLDEDSLKEFLDEQQEINYWPVLSVDDWGKIVDQERSAEENVKYIDLQNGTAIVYEKDAENATTIPMDPYSSWQLYRKRLIDNGFKEKTVEEIERATARILKRLSSDTRKTGPVKGLVIGNVQSGKTANMAALMAMAADWGWNMFIILSGTIESLRVQTQTRLFNDLNQTGNIIWRSLEHLSKNVDLSQKAQSLHFEDGSKEHYFTVCLKNSSRLSKLIEWAQADSNKQRQMKVLVIDDEADQAGINTANIETSERKKINSLICALVNGKNSKNKRIDTAYKAMNYIGYTATPYANVLNEASEESLYPRTFISTLAVSREYFGPQQIFGYSSEDSSISFDGLDIVRTISKNDLSIIENIHDGYDDSIPETLKDAICWFLCGVACMRIWGYKKPISMLVHTSQKTKHHDKISSAISKWFRSTSVDEIMEHVGKTWLSESSRFTIEKFRQEYPQYDFPDDSINKYPSYEDIDQQVRIILDDGISHIKLGDDGDLSYHKGIHLCIDNCTNNGITSDGMYVRLAYPDKNNMPEPAPAFIVVGGATLSRGLTIEGLISTYFLRSVGQADTLMQMGRWFGYRKGYELIPRLWITVKTRKQFEFLSQLDQELRDEIQYMDINGISPAEYGPKVKNSPKVSFIKITAKNKMQSASESEYDYRGISNQTYLFDDDRQIQMDNIGLTESFINNLGEPWKDSDPYGLRKHAIVWKNVNFKEIKDYLGKFKFHERLKVFNDTKPLLDWIDKMTLQGKLLNWNVAIVGKDDDKDGIWTLSNTLRINKVSRTRIASDNEADIKSINIGVLRSPLDIMCDMDVDGIKDPLKKKEIIDFINKPVSKAAASFRDKSGLEITPQLLIYMINGDSRAESRSNRKDLNAKSDIIGLCIYIPGGKVGTNYVSSVSIKMNNDIFDGNPDVEDADEN